MGASKSAGTFSRPTKIPRRRFSRSAGPSGPSLARHIRRQMTFNPLPLLIAEPEQVPAHDPNPPPASNQDRIVRAEELMSSDPNRPTGRLPSPDTMPPGPMSLVEATNSPASSCRVLGVLFLAQARFFGGGLNYAELWHFKYRTEFR